MQSNSLRTLLFSLLALGVVFGFIFPFVAKIFSTWKEGMGVGFIIASIVMGAAMGGISYALANMVLGSKLQHLAEVAKAIADYDFSRRSEVQGEDAIGEIGVNLNRLGENLRAVVSQMSESIRRVRTAADAINTVSQETGGSVQKQRNDSSRVIQGMGEIVSSIQEVARHAEAASDSAKQAHTAASEAKKMVTQNMTSVEALSKEIEQAAEAMDRLAEHSKNIGGVLDVIKGIAEQTNLLALNAAIEAARAGEQGRGFAVVADEVRTLATRTQQSTQEIQDMIEGLQAGASEAVQAMQQGRSRTKDNAVQATRATEALEAISQAVVNISGITGQTAKTMEQQQSLANAINANVQNIDGGADQIARGGQKLADSGKEISNLAGQLQSMMTKFRT